MSKKTPAKGYRLLSSLSIKLKLKGNNYLTPCSMFCQKECCSILKRTNWSTWPEVQNSSTLDIYKDIIKFSAWVEIWIWFEEYKNHWTPHRRERSIWAQDVGVGVLVLFSSQPPSMPRFGFKVCDGWGKLSIV